MVNSCWRSALGIGSIPAFRVENFTSFAENSLHCILPSFQISEGVDIISQGS